MSQNDVTFLKSLFLKIGTNLNKVENGFLKKVAKNLGISLESVSYVPRSEPTKIHNHKTSRVSQNQCHVFEMTVSENWNQSE